MAAHPDVEHWFITTCLEDYAQGAAQAASSLNIEDKVLICSNGANILIPLFESDSAGSSWVAGIYYAQDIFCEPLVCGVIAMLDGRATPETLYPEWKAPGRDLRQHPVRDEGRHKGHLSGLSGLHRRLHQRQLR